MSLINGSVRSYQSSGVGTLANATLPTTSGGGGGGGVVTQFGGSTSGAINGDFVFVTDPLEVDTASGFVFSYFGTATTTGSGSFCSTIYELSLSGQFTCLTGGGTEVIMDLTIPACPAGFDLSGVSVVACFRNGTNNPAASSVLVTGQGPATVRLTCTLNFGTGSVCTFSNAVIKAYV